MQVKGSSPDLDSSYFLDKEFWNELLKQHPERSRRLRISSALYLYKDGKWSVFQAPATQRTE